MRSNFPPRFFQDLRELALEQIAIPNRRWIFIQPLDLSRLRVLRGIYIYRCIAEAVTCSLCCTVSQLSSRGGVGCGRETRLPRIPMHLHNCAYKFRTLPEGFGWLIVSRVYVARCASSFADSEFYPNELFMRIRAILKRGCNFRLPGISIFVFAFRQRGCARPGPMKCFLLIRPRGVMTRCNWELGKKEKEKYIMSFAFCWLIKFC